MPVTPREWEISFKKESALGVDLAEESGRWKVIGVKPDGMIQQFNSSNPVLQVRSCDYIVAMNKNAFSPDAYASVENGQVVTLEIHSMQCAKWEVSFTKDKKLGVMLNPETWQVTEISAGGSIAEFNSSNEKMAVKPGDYMVAVKSGGIQVGFNTDVFAAIPDGTNVSLFIQRGGLVAAMKPGTKEAWGVNTAVVPGQMTMQPPGALPSNVPQGSVMAHEKYAGTNTMVFALVGCCFVGCISFAIFACPVDERDVYVAPDGRKYTMTGEPIFD